MQPLSLIEVVQEQSKPFSGWQIWKNQSGDNDRYINYVIHGNGWNILKALWPIFATVSLIILALLPFSFSLFRQFRDKERKQLKKELIEVKAYAKQRIQEADEKATKAALTKLHQRFELAKQTEETAKHREQQAKNIESQFHVKIQQIKIQAEQQIEVAETKAALAETLAAESERKKKNAAATAERRKRKFAKQKKTSSS